MNKFIIPIVAIAFVVFVSGCVNPLQQQQTKVEATPDLVIVQNQKIIPNPPIFTGSEFSLNFEVFNQDQIQEAKDVYVKAYDWGICSNTTPLEKSWDIFYPLQSELIEWKFKASTKSMTGGIETECPIRWKVGYTFSANTQIDVDVISEEKYQSLIRSGETPTYSSTQTVGPGPLKINFEIQTPQPVKAGNPLSFYIWVENKGKGTYTKIPAGNMYLRIPDGFEGSCEKFSESDGVYINNQQIDFIGKKSEKLFCQFKVPDVSDEKIYFIYANITNYNYELPFETKVKIEPGEQ